MMVLLFLFLGLFFMSEILMAFGYCVGLVLGILGFLFSSK